MVVKLKRGRLWFIACKTPIPYPPVSVNSSGKQVNVTLPPAPPGTQFFIKKTDPSVNVVVGPTLRPIRQPLYDSKTLDPVDPMRPRSLFQNDALGEYGYFWGTDDNEEVIWRSNWENAIGYDTRDEAEVRAFDVAVKFPHLIGKLVVMKLKVRLGS